MLCKLNNDNSITNKNSAYCVEVYYFPSSDLEIHAA